VTCPLDTRHLYGRDLLHNGTFARIVAPIMAKRDADKEALEQVEKSTESEPVHGKDLLESPELKRQLRESKERLEAESGDPV
jgi:hypothetical protein